MRQKQGVFLTALTDLRSLWIPPAVALAPIKPSVLPHGGLFSDSSAVQTCLLVSLRPGAFEIHKMLGSPVVSS